jgi:hypothetical protein
MIVSSVDALVRARKIMPAARRTFPKRYAKATAKTGRSGSADMTWQRFVSVLAAAWKRLSDMRSDNGAGGYCCMALHGCDLLSSLQQ